MLDIAAWEKGASWRAKVGRVEKDRSDMAVHPTILR
jgi:hypothetical protein